MGSIARCVHRLHLTRAAASYAIAGIALDSIGNSRVAGFPGLRIGNRLEGARRLEGFVGLPLLDVSRVGMLQSQARPVQRRVGGHFDGHLVLDDGGNTVLGPGRSDGVGSHGPDSQRDNAYGAAEGHARDDVALSCVVGGAVPLEVPFDDLALLAGVVDGRGCHADADEGHAARQGEGETRDGRGRGGARDQTRVVLPFPLQLLGIEGRAFLVVGLEVERHRVGVADAVVNREGGRRRRLARG